MIEKLTNEMSVLKLVTNIEKTHELVELYKNALVAINGIYYFHLERTWSMSFVRLNREPLLLKGCHQVGVSV